MDSKIEFALFLKKLRLKSGLSQGDVAKQLHYKSPQFISNWERGLSTPTVNSFQDLANLYDVKVEIVFNAYMKSLKQELWEKVLKA